jgi:hypothetical protein
MPSRQSRGPGHGQITRAAVSAADGALEPRRRTSQAVEYGVRYREPAIGVARSDALAGITPVFADLPRRFAMTSSAGWKLGLIAGLLCSVAVADEKPQPTAAETDAIAQIKQLGGQVLPLAQNDHRYDVAFHLADKPIGDQELGLIKGLPRLAMINLRGSAITDAGLAHLKDHTGLVRIHLEKTKITDAGLEQLKGLENLEYLNLYGTAVTDAGLSHLQGLKKLKKLYLWQTTVTDAGVNALKEAVPGIKIDRGQELAKPAEVKPEEKPAEGEKKP